MLFTTAAGIIFLGSNFVQQKPTAVKQIPANNEVKNTSAGDINSPPEKKVGHINPPKINISKLEFNSASSGPDSLTLNEVAKHNSKQDCYLIINNNAYDVSSYVSYHPGGSRIIASRCGKEVTGIFASIHSNRAWDLLKKYKIGTIATNKPNPTSQILTAISEALKKANPKAEIIKVRPKAKFYVAKIIYDGKLYEIHIDNNGRIIKEEIENEEVNWSLWENDKDDK